MALRVDRETALDWLGIERYRPSGRLRPPGRDRAERPLPAGRETGDAEPAPAAALSADTVVSGDPGAPEAAVETGPAGETASVDQAVDRAASAEAARPAAFAPAGSTADDVADHSGANASPEDGVCLAAHSGHRALGAAIARVGGLACREIDGATAGEGEGVWLAGRHWALADLAGDAEAKRRLWRALVARRRGRS